MIPPLVRKRDPSRRLSIVPPILSQRFHLFSIDASVFSVSMVPRIRYQELRLVDAAVAIAAVGGSGGVVGNTTPKGKEAGNTPPPRRFRGFD